MSQLTIVVIVFICGYINQDALGLRNFIYQKDVSEYCRRRALPSVFLSPGVMETNAQMLHFSRLDLPYSCFTSIRTEATRNIIMVIQLASESELEKSCDEEGNQLMVYEFAETFGGYWGPMPEAVIKPTRNPTLKRYTLKTTAHPTTTTTEPETTTTKKTTTARRSTVNEEFITIEVPLVNISGSLVPGNEYEDKSFDEEDSFDVLYDVTPRRGEKYDTSIIPLMQFAIRRERINKSQRKNDEDPRYQLEYDLGTFTPDRRLTLPILSTRSNINRNQNLWRRKYLMKKGHKFDAMFSRESDTLSKPRIYTQEATKSYPEASTEDSFHLIEDIMKSLNKSTKLERQEPVPAYNYVSVIKNISEMQHNFSAYLAPWPMYAYLPVSKTVVNFTKKFSIRPLRVMEDLVPITSTKKVLTSISDKLPDMIERAGEDDLKQPNINLVSVLYNQKTQIPTFQYGSKLFTSKVPQTPSIKSFNNSITINNTRGMPMAFNSSDLIIANTTTRIITTPLSIAVKASQSVSLVDHESWENVVQSAPVMAVLLNQQTSNQTVNSTSMARRSGRLSKRHIFAIPIEVARPHSMLKKIVRVTYKRPLLTDEVQRFAQLLELPDDEIGQRVALRFMRQFTGNTLFNICQSHDNGHKLRYVVLLNSSRIILAIGNFTISRMTVVMTTARTLSGSEALCPDKNIECQVGGSRVCIDSCSACDGVPNCGAHDIYDEDHLQCGVTLGLQHNVVLAAVTFLAVLLTLLYVVHYWLKRCVPKVADAFFVYTDGADNVLYLDSIMRSPTDVDTGSKYMFDFFEETLNMDLAATKERKSLFNSFLSSVSNAFKRRPDSCELTIAGDLEMSDPKPRKIYSFTELELRNMAGVSHMDEAVQTGESLEMAFLKMINACRRDEHVTTTKIQSQRPTSWRDALDVKQPLKIPKNDKDRRASIKTGQQPNMDEPGPSSKVVSINYGQAAAPFEEEQELRSTLYDHKSIMLATAKHVDPVSAANAKKQLRFQEKALLIPRATDEDQDPSNEQLFARHSVLLGSEINKPSRRTANSPEILPHAHETMERVGKDFRRFFKGRKGKKK